mgnify:CR=1 FL=1
MNKGYTGEFKLCPYFPAAVGNYRRGRRMDIDTVVIHVTQGDGAGSAIQWFQNPAAGVSAHYTVDLDGKVYQSVRESDTAFAAPNFNSRGVHIEHAGWVDRTVFTDAQLETSAELAKYLCEKYSIPIDREHILGHSELWGNDHTDPGKLWPWKRYLELMGVPRGAKIFLHSDGIYVKPTGVYGLKWPTGTRNGTVYADDRWVMWTGTPTIVGTHRLKFHFSQTGNRKLTAVAKDENGKLLGKDDLDIIVREA